MTVPQLAELSSMNTMPDRFSPWAAQSYLQEELTTSRSINRSITLTAVAAIWVTGIPAAAANQAQVHADTNAAVVSKDIAAHPQLDARSNLLGTLREYAFLEDGWDGHPSDKAPSTEAVYQASNYIEKLPQFLPCPDVSVASDGEVIVFWRAHDLYVDVSFRGREHFTFFAKQAARKLKGSQIFGAAFSSSDELATLLLEAFERDEMHV